MNSVQLLGGRPKVPATIVLTILLAVGLGLSVGAAAAVVHPLVLLAALIAPVVLGLLLSNSQAGMIAVILVIYTLPFGVIPVPLGSVKLTFLDALLSMLLVVLLARLLTKPGERLETSPLGGPIAVFMALMTVSFMVGLGYASIAGEAIRLFLKAINSVLFFFTVINFVSTRRQLEQIVSVLVLAGATASAIAVSLYFIPAPLANRLLSSLRVLGYGSGANLLRYNPETGVLRAIGTSVDPNILGAALMVSITLGVSQLIAPKPLLARKWIVAIVVLTSTALLLTYSRGAWVGTLGGLTFLAAFRERRLVIPLVAVGVAVWVFGVAQESSFAGHLVSGLTFQDQAAAMRLGEYKDAQRLIERYPWFGVGFGDSPSIDLYVGVSSIYLLLAEQMGLVGLASFLVGVGMLYIVALRSLAKAQDPGLRMLLLGCLASTTAALCAGVGDHYFVNMKFPHTVALFWMMIGLSMVASRLSTRREVPDADRS